MANSGTAAEQAFTQETVSTSAKLKQLLASASRSDYCKAAAVVVLFIWCPLAALRSPFTDPDIWWHMRTGEWIMHFHQVPRTDPFSFTGAGKPWVAYSWLFEIFAFWIGKYWDLLGLAAARLLSWVITTWAFFHLMRKVTPEFWRAAALTGLGSFVMVRVFGPRPGTFTILFFLVEFMFLLEADRTGKTGKLWLLPPLLCLWANIHAQFVYGLFLLGVFCGEPLLNRILCYRDLEASGGRIPNRLLWLNLALCTAATLVNPYGWRVYQVVFIYAQQVWSTRFISEMNPLPFTHTSDYLVVLLTAGAGFALGRDKRVRPLWVILLAWSTISAFRAQRDIWVLAIVTCTIIGARLCADRMEMVPLSRPARLAGVGAILVILLAAWQWFAPSNRQLLSYVALNSPLGAVAYIHEHHLSGPIFNNFDWGGFLIYALPEEQVAIDGRTNVHGDEELKRSLATWNGAPGWSSDPLLVRANLVVASPVFPLTQLLRMDPHFKPVFQDGTSVLFQRVVPAADSAHRTPQ